MLVALSTSLIAQAIPAKRTPRTVVQPDGTSLTVILSGDESFHWHHTADGIPLELRPDGAFCYARLEGGRLVATTQLAHEAPLRTANETAFIKKHAAQPLEASQIFKTRMGLRNAERANRASGKALQRVGEPTGVSGKHKGLLILVNYQDVKIKTANTRQKFDDMMNLKGYTGNGNASSVHDYFYAQSYGKLDLTFDVVGPVTVSKKMAYYGKNDEYGNDANPCQMIYEACQLVDDQVDFSDYDWNGDGEADQVYVIYAGYSESEPGVLSTAIWPHEWMLQYGGLSLSLDGVRINTYACSSELTGAAGYKMNGIGTPCHEFSHCLGLPDMYDNMNFSNFGLDEWSLMDYGCYVNNGYSPVGYTSYERMFSGWLEPTELEEPTYVWMKPLSEEPQAYIIYNEANRNEYYLLENRQKSGHDAELPGHGLLVIHVDYDRTAWTSNTVNNKADRQRCTIIAADNNYAGKGTWSNNTLSGDPFPGTSYQRELTDTSIPAATLYNPNTDGRKLMGKPLTEIEEHADRAVSFSFMGGKNVGIEEAGLAGNRLTPSTAIDIYAPSGRHLGTSTYGAFKGKDLPAGIYLLRTPEATFKVAR